MASVVEDEEGDSALPLLPSRSKLPWTPKRKKGAPYRNFFLNITLDWATPLLLRGASRQLEIDEVWPLESENKARSITEKFLKFWNYELQANDKPDKKIKLWSSLLRPWWWEYCLSGTLWMVYVLCLLAGPILQVVVIDFLEDDDVASWVGYLAAAGMVFFAIVGGVAQYHSLRIALVFGMRIKTALMASIYRKSLVLSASEKLKLNTGRIVNLMATDAQMLQDIMRWVNYGIFAPVQIFFIIVLLGFIIGPYCLISVVLMGLTVPFNYYVAKQLFKIRIAMIGTTDQRVKMENEVLQAIRIIKYFAWEQRFTEKIRSLRRKELKYIVKFGMVRNLMILVMLITPTIMIVLTFVIYAAAGNTLDTTTAFASLTLFNLLRFPFSLLPIVLSIFANAKASLDRIAKLYMREEMKSIPEHEDPSVAVCVSDADLQWRVRYTRKEKKEQAKMAAKMKKMGARKARRAALKSYVRGCVPSVCAGRSGASAHLGEEGVEMDDIPESLYDGDVGSSAATTSRRSSALTNAAPPTTTAEGMESGAADAEDSGASGEHAEAPPPGSSLGEEESPEPLEATKVKIGLLQATTYFRQETMDRLPIPDQVRSLPKRVGMTGKSSDAKGGGPPPPGPGGFAMMMGAPPPETKKGDKPTITGLDFQLGVGQLMMVIGPVGSGKSSLLAALFGEISVIRGSISMAGDVAYCSQQAWIQNATVRDNILFGTPHEPERYERVLEACALGPDLELLPGGDLTEIGERGINLSGGQKQRISIARAVYAQREIYVFDDPLSALDAHVGKHIFDEVFTGLLSGKSVILVTNQLQYLPKADVVMALGPDGHVEEFGSYQRLVKDGLDFAKLVESYGVVDEEGGDEEDLAGSSTTAPASTAIVEGEELPTAEQIEQREAKQTEKGKLTKLESKEKGSVSAKVYLYFVLKGTGLCAGLVMGVLGILSFIMLVSNGLWLSFWATDIFDQPVVMYMVVYIVLGIIEVLVMTAKETGWVVFGARAAQRLHMGLLKAILRAPTSLFDMTPIGRMLNLFSKDTEAVDLQLVGVAGAMERTFWGALAIAVIVMVASPFMIFGVILLAIVFFALQRFYQRSSIELQRVESVSRSPIFAFFTESLNGSSTIRAYNAVDRFIKHNYHLLDRNNRAFYALKMLNMWLGIRLEFISAAVLGGVLLLVVLNRGSVDPGFAALGITFALNATFTLSMLSNFTSETELRMNAVERMVGFMDIPQEAPARTRYVPPPSWPKEGRIVFTNYSMRYREGHDPVLRNLSFTIKAGHKVGVVGRTGAGKSSLIVALFRMTEGCEGSISIDGINTSKIGLADLRSKMAIIPQDPTLFIGSVRSNLDPFEDATDAELWQALKRVQMMNAVKESGGLDAAVSEGGSNFSVGQRQLMCLARALLRGSKILMLDEATASVDMETDDLIQQTIREEFRHCTVITIAHRLNTIMDSDRILVMHRGKLVEYDTPANLLRNPRGHFLSFVDSVGTRTASNLKSIAFSKEDPTYVLPGGEGEDDSSSMDEMDTSSSLLSSSMDKRKGKEKLEDNPRVGALHLLSVSSEKRRSSASSRALLAQDDESSSTG